MSALRQALEHYLSTRQALGFKLRGYRSRLTDFVAHLEQVGATTITSELAVTWATKPQDVHPYTWTVRLSMVSGFARYLNTLDPACEVPSAELLAHRRRPRPEPYLYSDDEVVALLEASSRLSPLLRAATYRTLFGLLAVTGLRVGEAIHLDRDDVDLERGLLVVWQGKFRKAREVPLHPSTVEALHGYGQLRDELRPRRKQASFFISTVGTRLCESAVRSTFAQLVRWVDLKPKSSSSCSPHIHGLRHTFAVATLLGWYRAGDDVMAKVPLLSTCLGHVDPVATYWYLQATPDLLAQAVSRLEHFLENKQ
jgi:integrase/recombinase XerD